MAGHRSPPLSSTTGANQASTIGTPSARPPRIFQEPSHRVNDGSRRSQPTPHSHIPSRNYGEGPPQHANSPHLHFHRPPRPMPEVTPHGVAPALPPWSPAHRDYEFFDQFYRRQPLNAPSSGVYVHQGGEALPPRGLVPQHLSPHASTGFFPLLQYAMPHDRPHSQAGSSYQFPVAPSRRVHDAPMPHLPYPQVHQSHQEASASHHALGPPQYHPQDQNDPPDVPPHIRPSEAPEAVETNEKKRKAPDDDEPASKRSAPKKSRESKVSSPQSQAQPLKRKRGRPPTNKQKPQDPDEPVLKASDVSSPQSQAQLPKRKRGRPPTNKQKPQDTDEPVPKASDVSSPQSQAQLPKRKPRRPTNAEWDVGLEKKKAANAQSGAASRGPSHPEPILSTAPRQEPRMPAPRQLGIPGNSQVSTTIPQPATSAEAPATGAREHQRSVVPLWATNLPAAFYAFINRHPQNQNQNQNQNDTDPISSLIPSAWLDLSNYPPIDHPSWPSVNSLTGLRQIHFLAPPSRPTATESDDEVGQDGLSKIPNQARDLGKKTS
ncbi:hypothetical protein EDD18DRAFT_1352692 [Armillaria luteobubalina]|uniref:Uncharacterized protein n=1 Tax=Armillaria luteobubalina TaxID=153913 RepID=A0AA39Q7Z2_9AGAR|nr:hypothetical protein EDD18DRAFT_1352692 [Armillaria luteobubalina]